MIAGELDGVRGPAKFAVTVNILDVELDPGSEFLYKCPDGMDNVMFYAFKGAGRINGKQGVAIRDTVASVV